MATILNVEQGGPEWAQSRLGIPTTSRFSDIITPKTRQLSKSSVKYRNELLAEWLIGKPLEENDFTSRHMERGTELEPEARDFYSFQEGVEVQTVGLVLLDDLTAAASPDGLVGEDRGLEIKCRTAKNHIALLLDEEAEIADATQIQGGLWICERETWDVLAYHPDLPHRLTRVGRDESYIQDLKSAVSAFTEDLERAKEVIRERFGVEGATESSLRKIIALVDNLDPVEADPSELTVQEMVELADDLRTARKANVITAGHEHLVNQLAVEGRWARARAAWDDVRREMDQLTAAVS